MILLYTYIYCIVLYVYFFYIFPLVTCCHSLDDNYSDDQFPRGGSPNGQYDSYYTEQHTGSGISDPMEDMTHMMHMMEQLIAGISVTMINPGEESNIQNVFYLHNFHSNL